MKQYQPKVPFSNLTQPFGLTNLNPSFVIFSIVLFAPWAFVGFDIISLETSHLKFSLEKSKGIIVMSIILSGLVYLSMAFVSIASVPDGYSS